MGRFGIEFSDQNNTPFKITGKKHYGSVPTSSEQSGPDGPFQKTLAWTSYYVLVFVALSVFNKPAMAELTGQHTVLPAVAEQTVLPAAAEQAVFPPSWNLRSTFVGR